MLPSYEEKSPAYILPVDLVGNLVLAWTPPSPLPCFESRASHRLSDAFMKCARASLLMYHPHLSIQIDQNKYCIKSSSWHTFGWSFPHLSFSDQSYFLRISFCYLPPFATVSWPFQADHRLSRDTVSVPLGLVRDISADLYTRVTLCSTLLPTAHQHPTVTLQQNYSRRTALSWLCSVLNGWDVHEVDWWTPFLWQCYMGHTCPSPDLTLIRGLHPCLTYSLRI